MFLTGILSVSYGTEDAFGFETFEIQDDGSGLSVGGFDLFIADINKYASR